MEALHELIKALQVIEVASVTIGIWMQPRRLLDGGHLKDRPFVALALRLDAQLRADDPDLKTGLRATGFDHFFHP